MSKFMRLSACLTPRVLQQPRGTHVKLEDRRVLHWNVQLAELMRTRRKKKICKLTKLSKRK